MTDTSGTRVIAIRGAREHNLRNVDIDIPRDELVVITGLSGSGKSSLAFDTIYAEGQRRWQLGTSRPVPFAWPHPQQPYRQRLSSR